jgi:peptidoglycan/LPS O-acetylase OafA/YrhL
MLFSFSSPLNKHVGYRSDIDGLRAVAVGLVVGFHAFPNYFPGGFIGVDIFFVISGYLISGIIFTQLEENRFSFFEFYAKRINRIFPALIAVLISCILLSKIYLFQNEITNFNHSLIAAVAFIANIFFYGEAGYFDSAAETKPLLHLWSLGVEEQFYIVWPIFLIVLWKFRTMRPWMLLILIALSISVNLLLVKTHQAAAFYLPISRFWELLLGSSLAYISLNKPQFFNRDLSQHHKWLIHNITALVGFLLIILSLSYSIGLVLSLAGGHYCR